MLSYGHFRIKLSTWSTAMNCGETDIAMNITLFSNKK